MVNTPVLVLNQDYMPLNICRVRRAVVLVLGGKAEVIENGRGFIHSMDDVYEVPAVIRLIYFIRRPHRQRKMTKLEVFSRDKYACQYCGRPHKELTLDHVVPRKRGGEHTWENVVSACIPCNRRKAGRTPGEAGMPLLNQPRPPKNSHFYVPFNLLRIHDEWHKYMPQ